MDVPCLLGRIECHLWLPRSWNVHLRCRVFGCWIRCQRSGRCTGRCCRLASRKYSASTGNHLLWQISVYWVCRSSCHYVHNSPVSADNNCNCGGVYTTCSIGIHGPRACGTWDRYLCFPHVLDFVLGRCSRTRSTRRRRGYDALSCCRSSRGSWRCPCRRWRHFHDADDRSTCRGNRNVCPNTSRIRQELCPSTSKWCR